MTRRGILGSTLALALAAAPLGAAEEVPLPKELPPFGPDRPLPNPAIRTSTLPNGLTVWLVTRSGFPKVTAVLAVKGGTAADPAGLEGVSEILAETLREGTTTRSSKRIAEELQAVGGEISARASDDAILVTSGGLSSGLKAIMAVLADVARNASFPPAEVTLAKTNALQGLQAREAQPEFLGQKAFAAAVYGAHPYRTVAPTAQAVSAVTPEILKKEFVRRFQPRDALLVVVGDVDAASAGATISDAFGGWKGGGETLAVTPPSPPAKGRELLLVDRASSVQSLIMVGRPTVTSTNPDHYPLLVANTIFGGAFGSRLTRNIREDKGYTYSPSSRISTYAQGGLLQVRADVRNDVTAASLLEIFYELDRVGATTPTPEELTKAKRFQNGLYLLRNQIQGAVAGTLAVNWVNGLPPEALTEFVARVNAVTAEQVRSVGRTYFPSATQTVVVVGDTPRIKDDLAQFGAVTAMKP